MALVQDNETANQFVPGSGKISTFVSRHRMIAYSAFAILSVWMSGYVLDVAFGPLSESTQLVHTIAGLLGATALVIAICVAFVAVLWAGLLLTNRS